MEIISIGTPYKEGSRKPKKGDNMRRCVSALLTAILLIACAGCFGDQEHIRFDNPDSRKYGEPDSGEGGDRDPGGHGERR